MNNKKNVKQTTNKNKLIAKTSDSNHLDLYNNDLDAKNPSPEQIRRELEKVIRDKCRPSTNMLDPNNDIEAKIPSPEEIRREFEKVIRDKFGASVQFHTEVAIPRNVSTPSPEEKDDHPTVEDIDFSHTPKQVKAHLDKNIIHQTEAKKTLAIAICDHYNHVKACLHSKNDKDINYAKQNVLMLGPTGVGKTYLVRELAKLIGVPFVKADATRFSETGYVGANVDDLVRDLVSQAHGDVELAQYGIVYLDEADKLASANNIRGKDITGRGVQFGLLKLMEETEVDLRNSHDIMAQIKAFSDIQSKGRVEKEVINTKHILFIVSGAFTGLRDIIEARVSKGALGLGGELKKDKTDSEYLCQVTTEDLIEFGFEPEFVGRLPVRVTCHELSKQDLFDILKYSGGSILKQYQQAFKSYNIQFCHEDSGLQKVAELAFKEKTGARGLATVLEALLRDYKFELPSTSVHKVTLNHHLVDNPSQHLEHVISKAKKARSSYLLKDITKFEDDFYKKHGIKITFDAQARNEILSRGKAQNKTPRQICENTLASYEHGFNLIQQNTNQVEFILTKNVVLSPKETLESWIKKSYLEEHPPKKAARSKKPKAKGSQAKNTKSTKASNAKTKGLKAKSRVKAKK